MTHEKLCWNILKISFNTPVSQYPSSMYLETVQMLCGQKGGSAHHVELLTNHSSTNYYHVLTGIKQYDYQTYK